MDTEGTLCQVPLHMQILSRQVGCLILFLHLALHFQPPPSGSWAPTAAPGPERAVTFGRAELAGVDTAVVLMHRREQQLAFPAIEMHLAFEQCRLQQAASTEPVYLHVGRTRHQALKQRHLPGPHVHVLQGGQHGQRPAFRMCWGESGHRGARVE